MCQLLASSRSKDADAVPLASSTFLPACPRAAAGLISSAAARSAAVPSNRISELNVDWPGSDNEGSGEVPTPWSITIGPGKLSTRATFVAKVKPLSARVPRVTPAPSPKPPRRGTRAVPAEIPVGVPVELSSPAGSAGRGVRHHAGGHQAAQAVEARPVQPSGMPSGSSASRYGEVAELAAGLVGGPPYRDAPGDGHVEGGERRASRRRGTPCRPGRPCRAGSARRAR